MALYGMPYQIDKIMVIADKYGISVVEDVAEGMDSRFDGYVQGTLTYRSSLSLQGILNASITSALASFEDL